MGKSKEKTKAEWLQDIVNDYIAAGEPWPADRRMIAAWAIQHNRCGTASTIQGRPVREGIGGGDEARDGSRPSGADRPRKYCAKIMEKDNEGKLVQRTLWFDRTAAPDLMHRSLQQRRGGILGDCKQLKMDQDSYNDNNPYAATIQLSFNFEQDLADAEHGTEYNPPPPPEDEDD